jgi:3-oxoadipate enol-lactonase
VIAPDLRGYGQSRVTPGQVSMHDLARDVWALLDELDSGDVAVVGLSMGGLVAMEMAIADPDRIWALGLVATTAEPVSEDERRERHALADEVESTGMQALVRSMGPRLFGPRPDPHTVDRVLAMMSRNDPRGSAAALRGRAARPDYRDGLRRLTLPSWVCVGADDAWSTPTVTRELVACLHEPRTLTLPGVGHLPNLEAPERFDAALSEFLRDAWRARA